MKRTIALLFALILLAGGTAASAQESNAPGPARVVVSIIPAGGMFFTEAKESGAPSFGNYDLGGAVTFNVNRYVGVEAEVNGALGVSQDLQFATIDFERTSPHLLNYNANLVLSAANHTGVVPYVTGGVGGLSLFEKESLGILETESFLTGNVGGGVTWYAGRWGLRGDYRFIAVRANDEAPAFFGRETRYGHRVYGGLVLNVGR
jgi:hypothetical protein